MRKRPEGKFYKPRKHAWHISPRMQDVRRCVAEHQCPYMRMGDVFGDKDVAFECLSRIKDEFMELKQTGKFDIESRNPMVRAAAIQVNPDAMTDAQLIKESPYVQAVAIEQGRMLDFFYNSPYKEQRDRARGKMANFIKNPNPSEEMTSKQRLEFLRNYLSTKNNKNSNAYDLVRDEIKTLSQRIKVRNEEKDFKRLVAQRHRNNYNIRPHPTDEAKVIRSYVYYETSRPDLMKGNREWLDTDKIIKGNANAYRKAYESFAEKHKDVLEQNPNVFITTEADPKNSKKTCFVLAEGFDTAEEAREASIEYGNFSFNDNSVGERVIADKRRWADSFNYQITKARSEEIAENPFYRDSASAPNVSHIQRKTYEKVRVSDAKKGKEAHKPNRNRRVPLDSYTDVGGKDRGTININTTYMEEGDREASIIDYENMTEEELDAALEHMTEKSTAKIERVEKRAEDGKGMTIDEKIELEKELRKEKKERIKKAQKENKNNKK